MKVLIIGSVYPRFDSDAEVPWLRASVAHLRKAGADVRVLAPAYKGLRSHTVDGVPVTRFRYAPASLEILTHEEGAPSKMAKRPWLQLLAIPYILNGMLQCLRLARKEHFDIIHAHWPFPHCFIALPACRLFHIPLVLNFHGAELLLLRKKKWIRPFMKFIIGQGDAIFANSSFTAGRIKALRPCEVEWSPYGTTLGHAASTEPHSVNGKFKILFVGRHIERKGIEYLIRAGAMLDPAKFEIRIVGKGDLTESLKALAAEVAPDAVRFTGPLSAQELGEEYRSANCFVLPAIVDSKGDTEGLGVVLIEAMEYGLPVVASAVGGIPDVVIDGETGILVPEKNPEALAAAFSKLAADGNFVRNILQGAQKRIRGCFDWDGITHRQLAVYESLRKKK